MTTFKEKLEYFFLSGWTSYISIAAGLLVLLAVIGITAVFIIRGRANEMTSAHIIRPREFNACSTVATGERLALLNTQRAEIASLGNAHRENAIAYFGYFYATYLVMTIFGLIAAISLAVITRSGISDSSPHVNTVFLISTAIVVLYQGSFDVLKQKANIDMNTNASVKYAILANQVDTYCTTGKISMKDPNDVLLAALPKADTSRTPVAQNTGQQNQVTNTDGKILPFFVEPDGDQFLNFIAWQMDHLRSFAITVDDTNIGSIDSKRFMF